MTEQQLNEMSIHTEILQSSSIDPATLYLDGLAASGRRSMRSLLQSAAEMISLEGELEKLPWSSIQYQHIAQVRNELKRLNKSPNTINLTLSAFRGVMKTSFSLGLIDSEQLMRINEVKRVRVNKLPSGRSLSKSEINKLIAACRKDSSATGKRDLAILSLMLSTGLRRSEVVNIAQEHYDTRNGELLILKGKGNKQRITYVPVESRKHIRAWLKRRGKQAGKLFLPINNNQIIDREMNSQSIYDLVIRRAEEAKIPHCRPHDFRRTFVTRMLESGVDINTVRQLAGHSEIQTTAKYDLRDQKEQRKAIKSVSIIS